MSKCLQRNHPFLWKLKKCDEPTRKKLIEDATPDQIRALSEIAHNIVNGNFTLSKHKLSQLKVHKHSIRKLSQKTTPHQKKKHLLLQKGGFLPFLIAPVLSALGAIAGKIIATHIGL
jgi:hypothetical protein